MYFKTGWQDCFHVKGVVAAKSFGEMAATQAEEKAHQTIFVTSLMVIGEQSFSGSEEISAEQIAAQPKSLVTHGAALSPPP